MSRRCKPSASSVLLLGPLADWQLKPTCVALMGIAAHPPTYSSAHARLIDTLRQTVEAIPASSFTPSLINYTLFPVTNILRHCEPSRLPDTFLESAFRLLALFVRVWRGVDGGIDDKAWEQLWRFTAAVVGPAAGGGKGKGKELDQEVQLQAVSLLAALLEPSNDELGVAVYPNAAMRRQTFGRTAPLLPTLFQTVSTLLEFAAPLPPHLELQLSTLRLLRELVATYLSGQPELLASMLPGIISAMTKLVQRDGRPIKGDAAKEIAALVEAVLVETLDDELLRSLGVLHPTVVDLSQFAQWEADENRRHAADAPSSSMSVASLQASDSPFPPLNASYLDFTAAQLRSSLPPFLSDLASHPVHTARSAAASLAYRIVTSSLESLSVLVPSCTATLLSLSSDDFDPVRHDARHKLRLLLEEETTALALHPIISDILDTSIHSLPRLIKSQQDAKVHLAAKTVQAIAQLGVELDRAAAENSIARFLGPTGAVERWGWALLECFELGRPPGWSASGASAARTAALGWEQRLISSSLQAPGAGADSEPAAAIVDAPFPCLPLRHVESEATAHALASMLSDLGAAGGESALYTVDYFLRFARANRGNQIAKAASALWVSDRLLQGVADVQVRATGLVHKATRKMARDATRLVASLDDDDEDDDDDNELPPAEDDMSDALLPIERSKGVDALTTLLDRNLRTDSRTAAQTRRLHVQTQRTLLRAVSLALLSTTSRILASSFRPLLLNTLYPVLAHLAAPSALVKQFAEVAIVHIASNSGYASPQNLIIDNVDYVINVVSQRLTYHRLSTHAPLVLIAMIRLVGEPIVPLVHDVVDDIFDALDDYHGYDMLASSLLSVLVTLIDVMASETAAAGPPSERIAKLDEFKRIAKPPSPAADFAQFISWHRDRCARTQREIGDLLERAPRHAWGQDGAADAIDEDEPPANAGHDPAEVPPTRSQEVCKLILGKAMFFLTHDSAFLRARVLSLVCHAVPVLAAGNRESDLLPLVDQHWPILLRRLDDAQPYVVAEAAEVVAALAEHVGDFMSRRVLDSAWPRFRQLLAAQRAADKRSALAARGGAVGTDSPHTTSHRLHVAMVRAAACVVRDVPVNDAVLWDMTLAFRPLLDRRAHEELQGRAVTLYRELGVRDADAVWVALRATLGTLQGDHDVWSYLRDDKLDIGYNAESLLSGL